MGVFMEHSKPRMMVCVCVHVYVYAHEYVVYGGEGSLEMIWEIQVSGPYYV